MSRNSYVLSTLYGERSGAGAWNVAVGHERHLGERCCLSLRPGARGLFATNPVNRHVLTIYGVVGRDERIRTFDLHVPNVAR